MFIHTDNQYTTIVRDTFKGFLPFSINNTFNSIAVWIGPQDEQDENHNDGSPATRIMNCYIDYHAKVTAGTGQGNIEELIDTVEVDMFKWLFKSKNVTANKYMNYDEASITGAVWRGYSLGSIAYSRNDESGIVLIQFPLKIIYQPQY